MDSVATSNNAINEIRDSTPQTPSPTVFEVINQVSAAIGAIGKNDTNHGQKFRFRSYNDMVNTIGPVMREHGLLIYATNTTATYEHGDKITRCRLETEFAVVAVASGHSITISVVSESADSFDKATSKARTMARKDVYQELFHISYDEPDPDSVNPTVSEDHLNEVITKAHRYADKSHNDKERAVGAIRGLYETKKHLLDSEVTVVPWWDPSTDPRTGHLGRYLTTLINHIKNNDENDETE